MQITPSEIVSILGVGRAVAHKDAILTHLSIDSRTIVEGEHTLFFALRGVRQQGAQYISDVARKGVQHIVLDIADFDTSLYPEVTFYIVPNAVEALQEIVENQRKQYTLPIVGITGSNGKTIVKEWLYQLLSDAYRIVKNPKSFNSQIGVPLSVWNIENYHTLGIFEAGISQHGEMETLERIILPKIGILTNIGEAHQLNFDRYEDKLNEKLKLFYNAEVLIVKKSLFHNYPQQFLQLESRNPSLKLFTWDSQDADVIIQYHSQESILSISYHSQRYSIPIRDIDTIYLENLSHCITAMLYLGMDISSKIPLIESLQPIEMRLEKMEGIMDTTLINDTYNADRDSLRIAIEFLKRQGLVEKSIILSEIENLGSPEIASLLQGLELSHLILIGDNYLTNKESLSTQAKHIYHYPSTYDFVRTFPHSQLRSQMLLIKGSRRFEFEHIIQYYQKKSHATYLKIHLNALKNNLNQFSKRIHPSTKMMVMLKAQAYGLGSVELARLMESQQVDYIAVAYTDEAVELRQAGIQLPIMILNTELDSLSHIQTYRLESEVYSLPFLKSIIDRLSHRVESESSFYIHLKLETGMNRLGIAAEELDEVLTLLHQNTWIRVRSILSHLAASDEDRFHEFTLEQIAKFQSMSQKIESSLGYSCIKHILNTGGIIHYPEYQMDMVRLGIGLFGISSSEAIQPSLLPTISLISKIAQIKHVPRGESIGYSRNGKVDRDSIIAIVNIGYADGYNRKFGNGRARVWMREQYFPTIGNVCMDMIMVDITDGNNIGIGDEVELIGHHIPISDMAAIAETIPYEIITSISSRVQRLYFED